MKQRLRNKLLSLGLVLMMAFGLMPGMTMNVLADVTVSDWDELQSPSA